MRQLYGLVSDAITGGQRYVVYKPVHGTNNISRGEFTTLKEALRWKFGPAIRH